MLWSIATLLVILWVIGVMTSYTLSGFIHLFIALAVIAVAFQLIQGRRVA